MTELPKITGVICTHNRERFLKRCIQSLYDQTLDQEQFEVLVVDNGSEDRTREICDGFMGRSNFRYVYEPVLGLSSARNRGWQEARGRYVGYLDDDATAVPTWFEKALWSFENIQPVPEWVGGPIDLEWEVDEPSWINDEYRVTLGWLDWGDKQRLLDGPGERLGGGNSFYLKTTLEKMNGFDTRLGRKKNLLLSGEETQFQHRLKSMGGQMFYHPGIRIHHFVAKERTVPAFFYKRYYWGGITDYLMTKTLQNVSYAPIAQDQVAESSQLGRLIKNSLFSTGLFISEQKTVRSRIYLAYVIGWLTAVVKYGWCRIDPETL
jgi:glucosyl-dolichyl phosphate glucuronosyltransferase